MVESPFLASSLSSPLEGQVHIADGGSEQRSWAELWNTASHVASGLDSRGVDPDDLVIVYGSSSFQTIEACLGIWLLGAKVSIAPRNLSRSGPLQRSRRPSPLPRGGRVHAVVTTDSVSNTASDSDVASDVSPAYSVNDLRATKTAISLSSISPEADDIAIVQWSSGSTGAPRAIEISHGQLDICLRSMERRVGGVNEVFAGWLPLWHDMGLIGLFAHALHTGAPLTLVPPERFLRRPSSWLEAVSLSGATFSPAPNFAYSMLAMSEKGSSHLDLGAWRTAVNGAEPIDRLSVERFATAYAPAGFDASSFRFAYGLAEATLTVTMSERGSGPRFDRVDAQKLEVSREASAIGSDGHARHLALLGRPIAGVSLRVIDERGDTLVDRHVGHVEVAAPFVAGGSIRRDGWLPTGDLGYLVDEELVVTGRSKDVIIVGGRNLDPHEIETLLAEEANIRRGRTIIFGVPTSGGTEGVVVVAEDPDGDLSDTIVARIRTLLREEFGIRPYDVVLIERGGIPKTTSGKLRRAEARRRWLEGTLA